MSSTPQSSVVSSVVLVERGNERRLSERSQEGSSRTRYLEKLGKLELTVLAFRQVAMEALEPKNLSHEDLGNKYCVDCLKATEAYFAEIGPWRVRICRGF